MKENELGSPVGHEQFPESFMAWHANIITIDRKKAIVLMNNETRFPVVIYRPVKKDFSNIKTLIREAIAEALRIEGVRADVIDTYLEKAGDMTFSKTANRGLVARLNNTVRDIEFFEEYLDKETKLQRYISLVASRLLYSDKTGEYIYPNEEMLKCLGRMCGM